MPKHADTPTHRYADTFFLVGPTAVGKSSVAQWIAEDLDRDILSADSMLVYKGMDIGTAKPGRNDRSRVHYYGIDLTTPDKTFSAWTYNRHARSALAESASQGRKTIVAGGTGLYIKGLTHGLASIPGSDPVIRSYWTQVLEEKGVNALQEALKRESPALYESLQDKQNARRLIRALELAESGIEQRRQTWSEKTNAPPLAGLMLPSDQVKSEIESRVAEMYRAGLVDEVRSLLDRYGTLSPTARQAIGYAEAIDFLNGRCSCKEAMTRTITRTRQLVKRQKTWFRHQVRVKWISIDLGMETREIAELVIAHWRKHGPTRIDDNDFER